MAKIINLLDNNQNICKTGNKTEVKSMEEFIKIVLYLADKCPSRMYKTKLNKLLFYTQFIYFKKYREELMNYDFKYDYYGPVLDGLNEKLSLMERANVIRLIQDDYGTVIIPKTKISSNDYTRDELEVLKKIVEHFGHWSSAKISGYSHEEIMWNDYQRGKSIALNYARTLRDI